MRLRIEGPITARAQHDVLVELLATQVEETVLEPYVLGYSWSPNTGIAVRRRAPAPRCSLDIDRDGAGRRSGFFLGAAETLGCTLAVDPHHPFRAQLLASLKEGESGSATTWVMP